MPNVNAPHGARLIGRNASGLGCPSINLYQKAASHGTAIFQGDIVRTVADTTIEPGGTPGTDIWLGFSLHYGAASKLTDHLIVDDPFALFEMQVSDNGIVAAGMNLNANFLFTTAGNAATLISGHQINGASEGTGTGLDVRLLRKLPLPVDINDWGANVILEVQFNKHLRMPGTAGV